MAAAICKAFFGVFLSLNLCKIRDKMRINHGLYERQFLELFAGEIDRTVCVIFTNTDKKRNYYAGCRKNLIWTEIYYAGGRKMQYQQIVFIMYSIIFLCTYWMLRKNKQVLRLFAFATLYAYLLTALFPYMVLWIEPMWIPFFYVFALVIPFMILSKKGNITNVTPEVQKTDGEEQLPDSDINESELAELTPVDIVEAVDSVADIAASVEEPELVIENCEIEGYQTDEVHESLLEEHAVSSNISVSDWQIDNECIIEEEDKDTDEEINEENGAEEDDQESSDVTGERPDQPDIDELLTEAFLLKDHGDITKARSIFEDILRLDLPEDLRTLIISNEFVDLDLNDTQTNIKQLLDEAFKAKFRDDYESAIRIMERILELNIDNEMIDLIIEDIFAMRVKQAS